MNVPEAVRLERRKAVGFILGPLFFIAALILPLLAGAPKAHRVLAVAMLVVTWWVTECIPIPVTALLIPVLFIILRIAPAEKAFAPFANPIIMLFLGSFVLAQAMRVHGLDRRVAGAILSRPFIGRRATRILLAFAVLTAFLSMWVSNTATAAMIYPIALGVFGSIAQDDGRSRRMTFSCGLLLAIAYAASIGGIGTPVGSPPNLIAIGMADKLAGLRISFFQWMIVSSLIWVPMIVVLFIYMKIKSGARKITVSKPMTAIEAAAPLKGRRGWTRGQKNVLAAFALAVLLWILPGLLAMTAGKSAPATLWFEKTFPEAAVALIAAVLLFVLPLNFRKGEFTLSLRDALDVDWGTLLLFGGGLTLGTQMFETGLADRLGRLFLDAGGASASLPLITLAAILTTVILTEFTSNTAAANMIIPVVIAISKSAGVNPLPPVLGSGIGCSHAFMLPISTPPNAIVYGSRLVPLSRMIKSGIWLDLIGVGITWAALTVVAPALGLF
jgi:sodium-dependent dicarboxylate transporter 2/3/5